MGNPKAEIPQITHISKDKDFFKEPDSDEVKFLRFCEKNTADTAKYFAKEAQKALHHKKFLGLFGGYHMNYDNSLLINSFEDVWESEDIDSIWAPAAYDRFREIQNASGFTCPTGSLKLKNKLHVNELDHRTEMACYPMEYPVAEEKMAYRLLPGNLIDDCYENQNDVIMVLRRELAATLQQGSALWWFDFFGGYYASPEYEKMLKEHIEIYNNAENAPTPLESVAEIAVIADTKASTYIRDGKNIHYDFTYNNLLEIAKCGAPYEVYNICDIEQIDLKRFKLFIFLNAFETDKCDYIRTNLKDKAKLWIYSPNVIQNGKIDYNGISEITGINIKTFHSNKILKVVTKDGTFCFDSLVNPMIEITDNDAEVLGRYEENGKTAYAVKDNNYYISCGNLSAKFFRELSRKNGVHIYSDADGALYVNNHFISFETSVTEDITLNLKSDCECEELFDGGKYRSKNKKLIYSAPKGTTKLFQYK